VNGGTLTRKTSFGQTGEITAVDRFGVWLSQRKIRRHVGSWQGKDVGDFGCGYEATQVRRMLPDVATATIADVSLAPDLKDIPNLRVLEGELPEILTKLPSGSLDIALCVSVLEHLWEPEWALSEIYRALRSGGVCFVNVPTWLGKRFLELSAFKLGLSPVQEMNDHKRYYDPSDLWPLLVRAGFRPQDIRCGRHKLGLNCFATCRKQVEESDVH